MRNSTIITRLTVYGAISLAILTAACAVGFAFGSVPISPESLWLAVFDKSELPSVQKTILFELRWPRILLGMLIGASLAMAGTAFQGVLRNPLADPYIVGTSAGASLGATIAIVLHIPSPFPWLSPVAAFAFFGAVLSMLAVYKLSSIDNKLPVETFLLAGVVVGSFTGALVSFLMTMANEDLHRVIIWLMGSLGQTDLNLVKLVLPYFIVGGIWLYWLAPSLNIISMGDENAQSMGVEVEKLKVSAIAAASLITAATVAAGGLIGFLGLFIPHVTRMIVGPDHRVLIPIAAINGGAFLVLADTLARTAAAPKEIPVGVITALVGAPFFFWLLHKKRRL